jgi:beta-glucosidase
MKRAEPVFLLTMLLMVFAAGCDDDSSSGARRAPNTEVEEKVDSLLLQMTLEEKIGQMALVDIMYIYRQEPVAEWFLGGLFSGGEFLRPDNSPQGWANIVDNYQSGAMQTSLRIPLLFGADAVHGAGNVHGAAVFPHNIGLGCTGNPSLVEEAARVAAEEMSAVGVRWTFAPCIAVPRDERWGRTYEGFAETPELTEVMGYAAVRGFQGKRPGEERRVLACAKHYLADGATTDGRDRGDTEISEEELRRVHLPGYVAAIRAGVGSIMISYGSWNGVRIHGDRYLITDVLKGELAFEGFVVSDYGGIDYLPGEYSEQVATAVNAGIDMIMIPDRFRIFLMTLKDLVREGRVSMERVDDAVRRILMQKVGRGLFESFNSDRSRLEEVGSEANREVARACVRQSVVLLKNHNQTLPLRKDLERIHVCGKNADNLGYQCGGWTSAWQGASGPITEGTTILQAIRNTVSSGTEVTYSTTGSGAAGADVAVVVVGETPYAEFMGDRTDLGFDLLDVSTIRRVRSAGVPLVLVLISGRPLILEPVMDDCHAVLAAWLPGTEGQGVADVLFGDYNPTGKLSHSWPRSMSQVPVNVGDPAYDPLFPYGFGLGY